MYEYTITIKVKAEDHLIDGQRANSKERLKSLGAEVTEEEFEQLHINGFLSSVMDAVGAVTGRGPSEMRFSDDHEFEFESHDFEGATSTVSVSTVGGKLSS